MDFFKPPTEKLHQIIARTAMFVSAHGAQSEIVLRVKQGGNPSFGFLMPDHGLHPYFRFLIDHQELLKSDADRKSAEDENKSRSGLEETGGALSLLGSVYGSGDGEDEEIASGNTLSPKKGALEKAVGADKSITSEGLLEPGCPVIPGTRDQTVIKHHISSLNETPMAIRKSHIINKIKAGTIPGLKKDHGSSVPVSSIDEKVQPSNSSDLTKTQMPILQPPSDMKRVVEKIVEFILRNGKEFEAVLVQQDANYKRFPFLLPSNQYHPYYLKTLQNAQEPRLDLKSCNSEKHVSSGVSMDKITSGKESDPLSIPSDVPYDSDRKEKFKMVIGKSKKEGTDTSSKPSESQVGVSMDAEAVAAILQAARKGIKNPNLEMFAKNSRISSDGGESSSFNSLVSSRPPTSTQKSGNAGVSVSLAKASAKIAAMAAANEADSSEASLTREEKLKAERLRRAKMFAAMIKSGAAPMKSEPSREKEGSPIPRNVESRENTEQVDRRSKRKYRDKSGKVEEDEEDVREDSRSRKRSHNSSRHSRESSRKHKRKHSSSKDIDSRRRHRYEGSSDDDNSCEDEYRHSRREHKEHRSSKDEQHGKDRRHSRTKRRRHDDDDEHKKFDRSSNRSKEDDGNACDEYEHKLMNNGEYLPRGRLGDDGDKTEREVEVGGGRDTIDVSDDLRAKVRAMLATI
ncbi:Protein SWAP [Linum grandiflorum]